MGVLKQGILGGVKGKVGSVVGSSWKGAFLDNGTFVPAQLIVSRGKLGATAINNVS